MSYSHISKMNAEDLAESIGLQITPLGVSCGVVKATIPNKTLLPYLTGGYTGEQLDIAIRTALVTHGFTREGELHGVLNPDGIVVYSQEQTDEEVNFDLLMLQLIDFYEIKTELGKVALKQALKNVALMDQKQQDYGKGNLGKFGEEGILVRLSDKLGRLENLLKGKDAPSNESVLDTWADSANYALIGQLISARLWK